MSPHGGVSRTIVVHRRFKEFCALDEVLRKRYKGTPQLTTFPVLPPRGLKLFQVCNFCRWLLSGE